MKEILIVLYNNPGNRHFATPYDSASGIPFSYVIAASIILIVIALIFYFGYLKEKFSDRKSSNIKNLNLNPWEILIETNYDNSVYEINCKLKSNNKLLFSIISNDYDKSEKYMKLTNVEDYIYIDNIELLKPIFDQFYDFVRAEGFNKIIVDDIPVDFDKVSTYISFFDKLGFDYKKEKHNVRYFEKQI